MGGIEETRGRLEQALSFYKRQTKLFEELHQANPDDVSLKNGLAVSYEKVAHLAERQEDYAQAWAYWVRAYQLYTELVNAGIQQKSILVQWTFCFYHLGRLRAMSGEFEEALELLREGQRLILELHANEVLNASERDSFGETVGQLVAQIENLRKP
ncbi:MAG: hypothetical protein H7Y12_14660 [Sphingobacteriaceae bacterium]|nr:hypothetical protein [Cytophagaceae bacterium]